MKPKELSMKWRDLIVDIKFARFDSIKQEQLARDFIDLTEHVLLEFYHLWSTNLTQFDLNLSLSILKEVLKIDDLLNEFNVWT